jgi:NTE family protein
MVLLVLLVSACATTPVPGNKPISHIDESEGYRRLDKDRIAGMGDTIIFLSFSGGGTRASALSYGVMQELRDTLFNNGEREKRVLDSVDTISSVSGGSFTAAYYGLYRDRLFDDYEEVFLRRQVQSDLISRILRPVYWFRSYGPGADRTEMAIDYYDTEVFRGATFNDIQKNGPPFIEINATDLVNGERVSFTQENFDLICSDLGTYPVSRAVTASSAVPGLFATVVLENHAGNCDISNTKEWELLSNALKGAEGESAEYVSRVTMSYIDSKNRPYIHLVDGGISDNLGLRAVIDRVEYFSDYQISAMSQNMPRNIVFILVNAEVNPDSHIDQSAKPPSLMKTMSSVTDTQMARRNRETLDRLQDSFEVVRQLVAAKGMNTNLYFTEVSFDTALSPEVSRYLNSIPTSLQLEDEQVDRLIAGARLSLRHDASFKKFKQNNSGRLTSGAIPSEDLCHTLGLAGCPKRAQD